MCACACACAYELAEARTSGISGDFLLFGVLVSHDHVMIRFAQCCQIAVGSVYCLLVLLTEVCVA